MSDIKKIIKLTEEQQELFTSGNMIVTGEERYYNFPYWLKDLGSGDFEIIEHTIDVSKAVRSFMEECQVDYSNRGLIDQIEAATEKDYCDISVRGLEKFIEDLKDENND